MTENRSALTPAIAEHLNLLVCPGCSCSLTLEGAHLLCTGCGRSFGFSGEIPLLFLPTENVEGDVTAIVRAFYEENPFPNYDVVDTAERLGEKARRGIFARLLDNQIPADARVLEVGCGTGQLGNFLGISGRVVFGTDICLNSLKLGLQFKQNNGLKSPYFFQMNLFKPVFAKETFDVVICNGVLHHTTDPFGGFRSISNLVKPGGYIIVGLYNSFGRIWTDLRRAIFRAFGRRLQFLDPYLRRSDVDEIKKRVWFADQYQHPHESKHTFDEVLGWFRETGFEFINGIPKLQAFVGFSEQESLFYRNPVGTRFDHLWVQMSLALSGGAEGGFFVMIGRKTISEGPGVSA